MDSDFLKISLLKHATIEQINGALFVLRHFIELNEKLLPILVDLSAKKEKSSQDLASIEKIKTVYESFRIDVKSSQLLMNSPILGYIQGAYQSIIENAESIQSHVKLMLFEKELQKLKLNWNSVQRN